MTPEDKARQRKTLLIMGGIFLVLFIGIGIYVILNQRKQIKDIQEIAEFEKQTLQEEYNEVALQYEGFKIEVSNDSILHQLESEQAKVQRLMEELRVVKSTNAARISELRRELETLRKMLRHYVVQIDSLNRANAELRSENQEVKRRISQVTSERTQLRQEKEKLVEQVTLASKLSVSNFSARPLNSRGKSTNSIRKMKQIEFLFTIDKNVTAEPGFREVYMRISTPDDLLLEKPAESGTFDFEGGQVPYSIKRQVEYGGEPTTLTMYWDIEEYLIEGTYRVELFADGYIIGRFTFEL
ncbi:MAG: hypothetical protein Q4E10_00250 [Porphyromonas sp.]|nr:hypothetical protein [Porphyromonas sp.]